MQAGKWADKNSTSEAHLTKYSCCSSASTHGALPSGALPTCMPLGAHLHAAATAASSVALPAGPGAASMGMRPRVSRQRPAGQEGARKEHLVSAYSNLMSGALSKALHQCKGAPEGGRRQARQPHMPAHLPHPRLPAASARPG